MLYFLIINNLLSFYCRLSTTDPGLYMEEMEVSGVFSNTQIPAHHHVLLKQKNGSSFLRVVIGAFEAAAGAILVNVGAAGFLFALGMGLACATMVGRSRQATPRRRHG